jgi:hypothetical protein
LRRVSALALVLVLWLLPTPLSSLNGSGAILLGRPTAGPCSTGRANAPYARFATAPRSSASAMVEVSPRSTGGAGGGPDGWSNRLYWGDNLQVKAHLMREFRGRIKLIYIAPLSTPGAPPTPRP